MNELGLTCSNYKNMTDTNKLLWLIWQELKLLNGKGVGEEENVPEKQIEANGVKGDSVSRNNIDKMTRIELVQVIKDWPKEQRPFGWTKFKTEEMRQIIQEVISRNE